MEISVIIPAYNVEDTIERCIDSVLAQTYPIHEIIVVEDCSTDGTLEKLKKYQGSIKMITHRKNEGLGITRGEGIMSAEGEYIYCIDSDDYIHPDAIKYLVDNADGGDIVTGNVDSGPLYGLGKIEAYYKGGIFINNRLIKKSLFEKAQHSELRVLSDADTLPRLLYYAEKTTYAPLMLYYYNKKNPNSITNSSGGIKRKIYQALITLHNYRFFLENKREWLFKLPLQYSLFSIFMELYPLALRDMEEYNRYSELTTEICSEIYEILGAKLEEEKKYGEQ